MQTEPRQTPRPAAGHLSVDAAGQWRAGEAPLAEQVAQQFARSLQVTAKGSYEVAWAEQREPLAVEDTPYMVTNLHVRRAGAAIDAIDLEVSDGRSERLDPATLMQAGEHVLYCRIMRDGFAVPCRFSPALYQLLALSLEERNGQYVLPMSAGRFPLGPFQKRPQRVHA